MVAKRKITQGRQKIPMEKIANREARNVCFSKRRNGVFTKASDLITLCGAEVAIVVKSPAGNPYSFGYLGVNAIVDRFLGGNNSQPCLSSPTVVKYNKKCMESSAKIDVVRAKKSKFEARLKELVENNPILQLADDMEGLGLKNLEKLEGLLVGFKANVDAAREEMIGGAATPSNSVGVAYPLSLMNDFPYGPNLGYFDGNFGYGRRFY